MNGQGGAAVDLHRACHSTSLDIITSYCFAQPCGALLAEAFAHPLLCSLESAPNQVWVLFAFPVMHRLFPIMPKMLGLLKRFKHSMAPLIEFRMRMEETIQRLASDPALLDKVEHETVWSHLINPPHTGFKMELETESTYRMPSQKSMLDEVSSHVVMFSILGTELT